MNIYVESNFVLELALRQEQYEACENILSICEAGRAKLVLPAFCIAEPYETWVRRAKHRSNLARDLAVELGQLLRSEPYREEVDALQNLTNILIRSGEEEKQRVNQTLDRVLNITEIIPLERDVLMSAIAHQADLDLSPPDSIVYASVLHHLSTTVPAESCFLNRNSKDFDDPDIVDALSNYNCKMLPRFDSGHDYIQSQIRGRSQ